MPAEERIAALEAENATLRAAVEALTARIGELEARLRADSTMSSRPPSSDGLAKKPATPRVAGGRRGKQPGAPGAHLARVADPDAVVEHEPAVCGGCGVGLDDAAPVVGTVARQVFDVPPVRLAVTEHWAVNRRCGGCGTDTAGVFPDQVTAPVQYGPGVRALIGYLGVYQHLPVGRLAQLLSDVLGRRCRPGLSPRSRGRRPRRSARRWRRSLTGSPPRRWCASMRPAPAVDGALHWGHSPPPTP